MKAFQFARIATATAALVSALAALPAQAYSNLFVFGDSISDSGNVALAIGAPAGVPQVVTGNSYIPPNAPYFPSGTFSNGPVWATDFAAMLGLSAAPALAGGTNFAFGGARTGGPDVPVPTLKSQVGMFLGGTGGFAPADALYVVAGVGNDARDALQAIALGANPFVTAGAAAFNYANNVGQMVDQLQGAGAQHILVMNTTNIGLAPAVMAMGPAASGAGSLVSAVMDGALAARLNGEAGVTIFDTFSFLTGVVANPGAYGLSNVSDACGAVLGANCGQYLFWDGIHPTAIGHRLLAGAVADRLQITPVPEPETYALMAFGLVAVGFAARRRKASV